MAIFLVPSASSLFSRHWESPLLLSSTNTSVSHARPVCALDTPNSLLVVAQTRAILIIWIPFTFLSVVVTGFKPFAPQSISFGPRFHLGRRVPTSSPSFHSSVVASIYVPRSWSLLQTTFSTINLFTRSSSLHELDVLNYFDFPCEMFRNR